MIRKDYILRLIEEIGKMIAQLLKLIKEGDLDTAQKLYDDGLFRMFNLKEEEVLKKETEQLREIFEDQFGGSFEGLEIVARFLTRGGDLHLQRGDEDKAKICYFKAIDLYNIVEIESQTFSIDRQAEMGKVNELLNQLS